MSSLSFLFGRKRRHRSGGDGSTTSYGTTLGSSGAAHAPATGHDLDAGHAASPSTSGHHHSHHGGHSHGGGDHGSASDSGSSGGDSGGGVGGDGGGGGGGGD